MPYSPKAIANYFIEKARSSGEELSPMKLQKLVYYAHGWYVGHTGKPLIDEMIEAWKYGPVIPSLYHEFKHLGAGGVNQYKATDFDWDSLENVPVAAPAEPEIRSYLDSVWNSYSKYTAITLSEMTHAPGSPWAITWEKSAGLKNVDITNDLIEQHFKSAIAKAKG